MVYHREKTKYKPVVAKAKSGEIEGISLSRRGNILLTYPEDPSAHLECAFGWEKEVITHLKMIPSSRLSEIISQTTDLAPVEEWIDIHLKIVFGEIPVPSWDLSSGQ